MITKTLARHVVGLFSWVRLGCGRVRATYL
jgi:hypothetical protein